MSNAVQTAQILTDLQTAIQAAWGNPDTPTTFPVSWDDPRLPIGGTQGSNVAAPNGYAVIAPEPVGIELSGKLATVGGTNQTNVFSIIGRFPWPSDDTLKILGQQITKANLLIAQLQATEKFGTGNYGVLPLVTNVEFGDRGGPTERMYAVVCVFQVFTQATHS